MLFSWKENVFMCLVVFQTMFRKIFSDVWLCSWKYHRKHIFYLLLTFSHIFYLLLTFSHIFSVTKQLYNIIYSLKHKQNSEKNHQIQTNEGEIAIARRSKRRLRSRLRSALLRQPVMLAARCIDRDRRVRVMRRSCEDRSEDRDRRYRASRWCRDRFSLSLSSIFQDRKYFEVKTETENHFRCFGSQIRSTGNAFQFDRIWSNNQTPLFSGKSFPESVWSQFKRSLSFTTFLNNVILYSCIKIILI